MRRSIRMDPLAKIVQTLLKVVWGRPDTAE